MHPIRRRTLLSGALAAGAVTAALPATASAATEAVTISAEGITLVGETDGSIVVRDRTGVDRIRISHFLFRDSVLGTHRTWGGVPVLVDLPDGRKAIDVEYKMDSSSGSVRITGRFDVALRKAHLKWTVTGSDTLLPTGFRFSRTLLTPGSERREPVVRWQRDTRGGIPFETNDGVVYAETFADNRAFFRLAASNPANTDATWLSAPAVVQQDGSAVSEADLVVGVMRPRSAATIATGGALGVDVWTDQPFNLWHEGGVKPLRAQVVNGGTEDKAVTLRWWARDFDGVTRGGGTLRSTIAARTVWTPELPVSAAGQGVVFTEVSVTADGVEAFARTNLTVLPRFSYAAGEESMFGLANYPWLLEPSKEDVAALLGLLGMKWVRIAYEGAPGIPPKELDQLGIYHNVQRGGVPIDGTEEAKTKWAADMVDLCVKGGARYYEAGNELDQPWMSGQKAAEYVRDGLLPLRAAMADAGATFKVMNCGLGGMDYVWLDKFHAAGGWDHIDVLAFHPGRGNFTPDYAPPPEDWQLGNNGNYWNFLGAVRKANQVRDTYGGGKELWLTEAYAATKPNAWWSDTYRHAAENVLLTLALAKAEKVRCVNWYTLNDTTIHHPSEADPNNVEYHFGLLNRDTSAKPSLLAFATAARVLDQATFTRWLRFADGDVKGLLFDTPDGPVSILWTRKDGYELNPDHDPADPHYATPEPWTDTWPTKTSATLTAAGASVRELDCLGRQRVRPVRGGKVTVVLDGAPRVFYGLAENVDTTAKLRDADA